MKAPSDLGERGKAFWDLIADAYDIGPSEAELLTEAVRTIDLVERLEAQLAGGTDVKIAAELRQQRLALGRLLAQLNIPNEALESPQTIRARKAARSRWGPAKRGRTT